MIMSGRRPGTEMFSDADGRSTEMEQRSHSKWWDWPPMVDSLTDGTSRRVDQAERRERRHELVDSGMTAQVYEWPCIYDHGHLEPNSLLAMEPMEGDECVCTCKLSVSKCCRYCQIVQHCLSKVRKDLGVKITSCFTHTQPRLIAVHGPLKCSVIKQIKAELLVNYGSTLGIVMSRCPVVCERLAVLSDGCTSSLSVN